MTGGGAVLEEMKDCGDGDGVSPVRFWAFGRRVTDFSLTSSEI